MYAIRSYYEFYAAGVYPDWWKLEPMATTGAWAAAVAAIEEFLGDVSGMRVLDCGCGTGVITSYSIHYTKLYDTLAREVQYICYADPSAFDPISGKSPLHYAGAVHAAALKKAISEKKDLRNNFV